MLLEWLYLFGSLVLLFFGAEFVLNSGDKLGKKLGMSPMAIGLLIVGFGTSLPEFFVTQLSARQGEYDIGLGNVVGSNIANIFLILGLSSIIYPLAFNSRTSLRESAFHLGVTLTLIPILLSERFGPVSGGVLLGAFLLYLYFQYISFKSSSDEHREDIVINPIKELILLFLGFTALYFGGELLVSSGKAVASGIGVSPYMISAIFVAFGTSFPELVTAMVSVVKKKDQDIIVGNILGSNVFNITLVLGSTGLYDYKINNDFRVELLYLSLIAIFFVVLSFKRAALSKLVGFFMLAAYVKIIFHWIN